MRTVNPDTVVKPASNYAQAVLHAASAQRLVISGQIGVMPDGRVVEGFEAQTEQAWRNVISILHAAGFEVRHLVKATVFATVPGQVAAYRTLRDQALAGHTCAMTYVEVAGLASPEFLVEIEAEAVREA